MRSLARSFAAGEITPELFGRVDLASFQTGLATCRNFVSLPHGPVENRPGTEFVLEVKTSAKKTRLIPFTYSTTQTMVLEFGENYIRFHTDGGTLLLSGSPYEVVTPYAEADLFDIHYVQSADVLTLVHPGYAPRELRRLGVTNWTLGIIDFGITQPYFGGLVDATAVTLNFPVRLNRPTFLQVSSAFAGSNNGSYVVTAIGDDVRQESAARIQGITGYDSSMAVTLNWGAVGGARGYRVYRDNGTGTYLLIAETSALTLSDNLAASTSITPGGPASFTTNTEWSYYVLTAIGPDGQESLPSLECSALNDLTYPTAANIVHPTASTGLFPWVRFNVYKKRGDQYGYIGSGTPGETVKDDNIEPDMTHQPPVENNPFVTAGNWPQAVSYFEQRRLFAGTTNALQNFWATRTGTESNLTDNAIVRPDDAIAFRIAAREANTIRHIIPLGEILLLTSSTEWRVNSSDNGAITPATVSAKPQSYVGASNVQPITTSNSVLYTAARGSHLREIVYSLAQNGMVGYTNVDLSLMAPHLFNFKTITDLAFSKAPYPILWAISSDGTLLGLTYVPSQQVAGWHRHDTDGVFESCAVVTEGDEDMLYVVVRRTINGSSKRYVERLHTRQFATLQDAFFVDCGLTYSGAAATTISGLNHLEGKTVSILGNGAVFPPKTVVSGAIHLDEPVTLAHIGLPITADMQTLPMAAQQIEAFGQGRPKNITKAYIRVYNASGILAGPDAAHLKRYKQRTTEAYGSPPRMITEQEVEIPVDANWNQDGALLIRQTDPLPLTVLSLTLDGAVGG